jgi:TonB family protein
MTYTLNNMPENRANTRNNSKSNIYGLLGSALSCLLLFLIMWFYVMPYTAIPQPVEEEGIMVSFGNNEDAGGMGSSAEPLAAPEAEVLTPAPVVKTTSAPQVKEQLLTQNDNSNEIAELKQKEQEKKLKQQIDKQKLEAEQRVAQQKKKEQDAINKAATVNGLFANGSTTSGTGNGRGSGNGTGSGSGNGSGEGIQGNPAGHGNLGGNSFSLNGRSLTGRLLSPSYDKDVEGKVTVSIRVDENGRVSSTSIGSPTTISDSETRNAAMTAAKNTRFSSGNGTVSGTITYNFKLR